MTANATQLEEPSHAAQDPRLSALEDLDNVNLQQALRDFEVANARVLDLTRRLLDSERQRRQVEDELARLKLAQPGKPAELAFRAARFAYRQLKAVAHRVAG